MIGCITFYEKIDNSVMIKILFDDNNTCTGSQGMMRTTQRKRLRIVVAGLLWSLLLFALVPLSASAAEYTFLAAINTGLTYPIDVAASGTGKIYIVDGIYKKVFIYNGSYNLSGAITSLANPMAGRYASRAS